MIGSGLCLSLCFCLRYVKVFPTKSRDNALWPRLDKDPSLKTIPPKLIGNQVTQQFKTIMARSWYDRKATIATQCTIIPWSSFSEEVKESLKERFQPLLDKALSHLKELEGEEEYEAGEVVQSSCDFATRSEDGLKEHEKEHPTSAECGQKMKDQEDLEVHVERLHDTFKCALCAKSVQVDDSVAQVNMHNTQDLSLIHISEPTRPY